jgi:hypothetical protein
MTKKDLIEFLKDYPDDIIIKFDGYYGHTNPMISDWFDYSGRKTILITEDRYGDD